ncbi:MAG: ribosome biogenesis GTPase Der, partial [Candidatus Omnitrophota bacterium]
MKSSSQFPTVSIVGRPNVGKSSLFNCLLGERRAVVVEQSGTTRDRLEAVINVSGISLKIVDTGGYMAEDKDDLSLQIKEQINQAMEEASVILLVVDTMAGISPMDREVASILRKFGKPVILAANKADNERIKDNVVEFYQLGFGDPVPVSCVHRKGIRDVKECISRSLEGVEPQEHKGEFLKIAVVGRPNVGKSSFINNLLARKRVIVSEVPGTTRDSIDTHFTYEKKDYILIDTAGIRHRRKIKTAVDTYSTMRAKESIKRADTVILLLDAADGITRDDLGILGFVEENGKACLILVNKWDLAEEAGNITMEDYTRHLVSASSRIGVFPMMFISATTGKNVLESISLVDVLDANLDLQVSTPYLNKLFEKKDPSRIPISRRKKRPNFMYITQTGRRPVEFSVFVNDPAAVLPVHLSYIKNLLRRNLPLKGIPVKLRVRKS